MDAKAHATQIDSIILLDNNHIAVSGGPLNYEVLIYRNRLTSRVEASTQYDIVDSINTAGHQVWQMHLWGCQSSSTESTSRNLLLVLASNSFMVISKRKDQDTLKWRDIKHKRFDFSQIKGDFVNLIELKQYQRENADKDLCSSIFVSLHMGY